MAPTTQFTTLFVFLAVLSLVSAKKSSTCRCAIKGGQSGARLIACKGANRAQAYAYATGLTKLETNACIRRIWNRKITQAHGAFGLCSSCANGAQANTCVKYARDIVQEWCAAKPPKQDQPRCKCSATPRGVGKSTVSCKPVNGGAVKVNVEGLSRNATELRDCFSRNITPAVATLYCRPCTDADRARSCANFIKFTAKTLCRPRAWFHFFWGNVISTFPITNIDMSRPQEEALFQNK